MNNAKKFDELDFEKLPLKSASNYCISKRLFTNYLLMKEKISSFHFILPTIYGAGENSMRIIPYIVDGLINNHQIKFTSGSQVRQYLHIDDLCKIVEKTYLNRKQINFGIYNIGYGEIISIKDLVYSVFSYFGKSPSQDLFDVKLIARDTNMSYLAMNNKKLDDYIHYECSRNINSSIADYVISLKS